MRRLVTLVLAATTMAIAPARATTVDAVALEQLYDYAFTRVGPEAAKTGIRTNGLVIAQGGEILVERYHEAGGFTATTPHIAWSVTKSVLNAVVGAAVHEGALRLEDRVGTGGLRVKHLLEMSSCLDWAETYEGSDLTRSSVLAMLYGRGTGAMAAFAAERPFRCAPGSRWSYSSGDSVLLAAALAPIFGAGYADAPWRLVFEPLGMEGVVWERDASGHFIGSSYLYAPPRALARLGHLFNRDGVVDGRRILPAGWARYSARPVDAYYETDVPADGSAWVGGASWWSNAGVPEKGLGATWPAAPADMLVASGHWGQAIYAIPSLDLVIVRTADDRDGSFDENRFLELALAAVGVAPSRPDRGIFWSSSGPRRETPYWQVPGLSSAFVAKEMCSCLYVMGRSEEQCAIYASQEPMFAKYTLDRRSQAVHAALRYASVNGYGLYPRTARYKGERYGCTLD